jgi:hypothetical protein
MSILYKIEKLLIVGTIILLSPPHLALAQTMDSTNYQIENPMVGAGDGGDSSSTNYKASGSFGNENDTSSSSTNYKAFPGFVQHAYPGVPGTPTLTNTGGTLYTALDFVIATGNGQQTDTTYAIAISSDNFTTTYYIQTDDTLGTTAAWQSYTAWGGGSGERVTGLSSSTTYKIKVKARYGADTETGFSQTATAATAAPSLTITFAGVNSGNTFDGETTTITSTSTAIAYGTLVINTPAIAAHQVTVTTNATAGYSTTVRQDGNLRTTSSNEISPVSGTNASPASWPGSITTGRFGYHTSDEDLCTGSATRFSTNNTWAALDTTPYEVGCNTGPVTGGETTTITYKLEAGTVQEAGTYTNTVTYISSAQF